ncbi:hypothetical protein DRN74_03820 [Candidatus Micrarchaeota archaeon]|nr:MAG: hypothetical protein DRN74_03820 [Candidatus Micrarchaeota archaeon]
MKVLKNGKEFIVKIEEPLEEFMNRGMTDRIIGIDSLEARVVAGHIKMRAIKDNLYSFRWNKI